MSPYFAHRPATLVLFGATLGAWFVMELRQSLRHRTDAARRDQGSYYVLVLCVAAGWVATSLAVKLPRAAISGQPAAFIIGLVLAWNGIALRRWAITTLGSYFTFHVQTSADQPVITSGPYRIVRHPGYTGVLLFLIGLSLLFGTWLGFAAMALLPTTGLINRIRVEERALNCDLGPAYRTYAANRKRLIPYVW